MLSLYIASLLFGGIFIGSSLVLGSNDGDADHDFDADADVDADMDFDADADVDVDVDADADFDADHDADFDADHDADFDADHDADHDIDHHVDAGGGALWIPFLSLRFWTFAFTAFGLLGTLLTLGGFIGSAAVVGALSGTVGVGSGWGAAAAFRKLKKSTVSSGLQLRDYVGASAKVLLPVSAETRGKVRLQLKGHTVTMIARTDEEGFERGEEVFVLGVEDGMVVVTASPVGKRRLRGKRERRALPPSKETDEQPGGDAAS